MRRPTASPGRVRPCDVGFKLPLMFVVVAVEAEQLPVAAICRIVLVIVIAVMHRQLAQVRLRELAGAPSTYPRIDFQRSLTIAQLAFFRRAPGIGHYLVQFAGINCRHCNALFSAHTGNPNAFELEFALEVNASVPLR